jgi:hypothetical protein
LNPTPWTGLVFPGEIYKMGFSDDEVQRIMLFHVEPLSIPEDQYDAYNKTEP